MTWQIFISVKNSVSTNVDRSWFYSYITGINHNPEELKKNMTAV